MEGCRLPMQTFIKNTVLFGSKTGHLNVCNGIIGRFIIDDFPEQVERIQKNCQNIACLIMFIQMAAFGIKNVHCEREKKIEMHFSFVKLSDLWNIGNKKKFEIFAVIQHFD